MKNEIQPNYVEVTFVCACGAEFAGKTAKPGVKAGFRHALTKMRENLLPIL